MTARVVAMTATGGVSGGARNARNVELFGGRAGAAIAAVGCSTVVVPAVIFCVWQLYSPHINVLELSVERLPVSYERRFSLSNKRTTRPPQRYTTSVMRAATLART
jgi:hypothetical protein